MSELWKQIERILPFVETPAQYVGGEVNSIVKTHTPDLVKVALAFPDVYKIGMSHAGMHILYSIVNRRDDALAERVFTPWLDMQKKMREAHVSLFSLETHTPVREFDIVGFSLQHEMCYTNVLEMLDLAGIPLRACERGEHDPLVIAGGPCAVNPEPMAEFMDVFVVGDGEEALPRLIEVVGAARKSKMKRRELLLDIATSADCFYVPAFYETSYHPDGRLEAFRSVVGAAPSVIRKAVVKDLDAALIPSAPVVPFPETVHERISLEIMRGCPNSCRFCQSAPVKSPVRLRSMDRILAAAEEVYRNTGYDEISLVSLSSGDCPGIEELLFRLSARFKARRVGVSLPSLRIDSRLATFPAVISAVRKAGLTLAPEAATDRLRAVLNKPLRTEDLFETVGVAFKEGWNLVKLYFMIGLPTETEADVDAIADLAQQISSARKPLSGHNANVNVTISPFVPKPHTPFQWEAMATQEKLEAAERRIKQRTRMRSVKYKVHNFNRGVLEGVFSRGDRRCGRAIELAWRKGCRFDSWDDHFRFDLWLEACREAGIDPSFYAHRERGKDELLPWDHIDVGQDRTSMWCEREKALEG